MVVNEGDGTIPEVLEILEFLHHVLRTAGTPLPLVEDRNIAEDAGPGASARGLHGREPLHGQDGRHIERHGFDEVQRQALPIGKRPLIKVALHRSVGVGDHMTILRPGESRDVGQIVHTLDEIKDELLPVPAADKVYFRALVLDQLSIEADKHPSERQLHLCIGGADLASEDLRVRVAGCAEETQADEGGLPPIDFLNDDLIGCLRIRLVEHHTLVACALQHS